MASPLTANIYFETKLILHRGTTVRIVLQGANGPCPLLALANVLALRGQLNIPLDPSSDAAGAHVTTAELLTNALAALAMERLSARNAQDHGAGAGVDQALSDVVDSLPRLLEGMFINVGFRAPDDYECTADLTVFDALGVRLLHGWVADEACDGAQAKLLHKYRFNALQVKLTTVMSPVRPSDVPKPDRVQHPDVAAPEPAAEERVSTAADTEAAVPPNEDQGARDDDNAEADSRAEHRAEPAGGTAPSDAPAGRDAAQNDTVTTPPPPTPQQQQQPMPERPPSESDDMLRQYSNDAQEWLATTGTQITLAGILALQKTIAVGELVVLFRGSHFSVLSRSASGTLFHLVTDEVMARQPGRAWESIEDTEGTNARFVGELQVETAPAPRPRVPSVPPAAAASATYDGTSAPHHGPRRVVQAIPVHPEPDSHRQQQHAPVSHRSSHPPPPPPSRVQGSNAPPRAAAKKHSDPCVVA